MEFLKKATLANGKPKPFGFDTDADFIPFEFSDEDTSKNVTDAEVESRGSVTALPRDPGSQYTPIQAVEGTSNLTNGEGRKRKRDEDGEEGPPSQRPKTSHFTMNPWQKDINGYTFSNEVARILHKEVQDFCDWISPTEKEDQVRGFVVRRIINAIESAVPDSHATAFGSFITKLYLPDADIDMMVERSNEWTKESMRRVGKQLERHHIGRSFQYIMHAKVPIIKFVETSTRIDVDLSFNQTNSLAVASLVQQYLREMPALKPLVMVLKTLFVQRGLSVPAEGGLGSYSIICLVISFLQRHPKIVAGHINAQDNLGALLIEILELYGTRFNFDKVGIAIDQGGSYFLKDIDLDSRIWRQICIRDPNDRTNNISKASWQMDKIIKLFADAYKDLTTRCYVVHGRIADGQEAPWGTAHGSILDSIIRAPSTVVRERIAGCWKEDLSNVSFAPLISSGNVHVQNGDRGQPPLPPEPPPPFGATVENGSKKSTSHSTKGSSKKKKKKEKKKNASKVERKRKKQEKLGSHTISNENTTAVNDSKVKSLPNNSGGGTRHDPILLDDLDTSTKPSSRKKRLRSGDVAAANLEATGSITGIRSTVNAERT